MNYDDIEPPESVLHDTLGGPHDRQCIGTVAKLSVEAMREAAPNCSSLYQCDLCFEQYTSEEIEEILFG